MESVVHEAAASQCPPAMSIALLNRLLTRRVPVAPLVRQAPLPLLDGPRRTAITWSAKSACTHVLIWYLDRTGLLADARAHHPWVHRYRGEVLHRHPAYLHARQRLDTEGPGRWTYVKVVRDPVRRCVSSYRHALKHGYENRRMAEVLARRIDHIEGFSFETFLDYLARIDLRSCNIHHRVQKHALDTVDFGSTFLINADEQDLDAGLSRIDELQGCAWERGRELRRTVVSGAARRHADRGEAAGSDDPALWRQPLSRADVPHWPASALSGSPEVAARVRHIYACDYAMLDRLAQRMGPA